MPGRREGQHRAADVGAEGLPHQQRQELLADDDALDDVEAIGALGQPLQVVVEPFLLRRPAEEALEARADELLVRHDCGTTTRRGAPNTAKSYIPFGTRPGRLSCVLKITLTVFPAYSLRSIVIGIQPRSPATR